MFLYYSLLFPEQKNAMGKKVKSCQALFKKYVGRQNPVYLGSGIIYCSACTWINVFSSNKIQRHYKGLKMTACMSSWGKLWTRRYKKTKNWTTTSQKPGTKPGYCTCPLHITPPKGWANHLSCPSGLPLDSSPILIIYKETSFPLS